VIAGGPPHSRLPRGRWGKALGESGFGGPDRGTRLTHGGRTPSTPYLIEVAGVAGVGKSTLTHLLCQGDPECRRADFIHARTPEHLAYFAHSLPRLLPVMAGSFGIGPRLRWADFKLLVYVTEWKRFLNGNPQYHFGCTVLDQGPLYALVRLKAEAKGGVCSAPFERWWNRMVELWAAELDLIIWLDAADQVVWDRINERVQRHKTKGEPVEVGRRFIVRYRRLFEEIFDRVNSLGGAEVLRFDTSETRSEQIAAQVGPLLTARGGRVRSATDRSEQPHDI
jgi:hypothetical protein